MEKLNDRLEIEADAREVYAEFLADEEAHYREERDLDAEYSYWQEQNASLRLIGRGIDAEGEIVSLWRLE